MNDKVPVKSSITWRRFLSQFPGISSNRLKITDMKKSLYIRGYLKALVFVFYIMPFLFLRTTVAHPLPNSAAYYILNKISIPEANQDQYPIRITAGEVIHSFPTKGISLPIAPSGFKNTENKVNEVLKHATPDLFISRNTGFFNNYGISYLPLAGTMTAPPTIVCPGNHVSVADPGVCSAMVNGLAATINDPDGDITTLIWTKSGVTIAASPLTGINNILTPSSFNVGITTVTYTVKDAGGTSVSCSFTVEIFDSEPPSIACHLDTTITIPECFAFATGIILAPPIVSDNCGILNLTNNAPAQFPVGNTSVIWIVNDINGLTSSCKQIVTVQKTPAISITLNSKSVSCFGLNNGTATATVAGGMQPYIYSWNTIPVQTTATATNLSPGTYTVTITDAGGCTATSAPATITEPASALSAAITGQLNVICFGNSTGSVTVAGNGGTPSYQYAIDGGLFQASGTFPNLAAGSYAITVRDANNCTFNVPVVITQPASGLLVSINSQTNVACFGEITGSATATATGGTPSYTYSWNTIPVQTTATATGLAAGTYTVTATDAAGCTKIANATITQPPALIISITNQVNVACFGEANGSATITVTGGAPPYTYSWNTVPVQTNAIATNLAAGNYTVTVTDANACTATFNITITEPSSSLSGSNTNQVNVTCFGNHTGSFTITGSGGTPTYQYSLDGGAFQASGTFSDLAAGTYTVTVSDANNCTFNILVNVIQPLSGLTVAITVPANVLCKGEATGSASVTGTGGTLPYTYSWNTVPTQTTATAINLAAGTYIVTVTEAGGCTATATITITEPVLAITASISSQTNETCSGQSTGNATITTTGGTSPYTYSWNTIPEQTTTTATGLAAGTFIVTVSDAAGCSNTANVTITQPVALIATITDQVNENCAGNADGSITVESSGGTPAYQYSLDGGTSQSSGTFSNLIAGSYTVTVQDAGNCTSDIAVNIAVIGLPQANDDLTTTPENIPVSGNVMTNDLGLCNPPVTVTSNTTPTNGSVLMLPDGSFTYTPVTNNYGTDFFFYTITDSNGSTSTATVVITITPGNAPPIAVDDYDTTNFNEPITIHILVNDSDLENDILNVSICGSPTNGLLNVNEDGSVTYSPNTGFSGDDEFCYTICDNGTPSLCDTALVYINVKSNPNIADIFVYNGFSPNGDGNNDHLVIRGIEAYPDNVIQIFNRYGDKIRALSHYDNHNVFWDGTNNDGKPVPDGTYFYILKINDISPLTGWVFVRGKK